MYQCNQTARASAIYLQSHDGLLLIHGTVQLKVYKTASRLHISRQIITNRTIELLVCGRENNLILTGITFIRRADIFETTRMLAMDRRHNAGRGRRESRVLRDNHRGLQPPNVQMQANFTFILKLKPPCVNFTVSRTSWQRNGSRSSAWLAPAPV
ncbi:hypothetical protein KGM_210819 [Danaus plexippus plexippus]|uniref:Uncharacterized protein n=1 Tax=Danaus plexippus plexippus TaxID=278856 RepID=A0A212EI33_DANPL|nr:hypothetical protein KGM_210819 [Danaus plexippus plexippus]